MSAQFVRYTPDIEATEPDFDKNLQIVIDKTRGIHCRIGGHRGHRPRRP